MLIGISTSMVIMAPQAPVRHAAVAGFLTAWIAVWAQAAFLPLCFDNNPAYRLAEIPFGLSAEAYTALFAPVGAAVAGLIMALTARLIAKLPRLIR